MYKRIFTESYLGDVFGFKEFDQMSTQDFKKLDQLFKQRDDLVEKGVEDSELLQKWMDFGSINTFQDLLESEGYLLKLLKKGKTPVEKTIAKLTQQILKLLY